MSKYPTERIKGPDTTPILGIPLLTEEQKANLFERDDRGITPVLGITRYPTFEDWMERDNPFGTSGVGCKGNFTVRFLPGPIGQYMREAQHFQRFALLYPGKTEELIDLSVRLFGPERQHPVVVNEDEERMYWDAYEKLADLVDANDDPLIIANGWDIPHGMAVSTVLTG